MGRSYARHRLVMTIAYAATMVDKVTLGLNSDTPGQSKLLIESDDDDGDEPKLAVMIDADDELEQCEDKETGPDPKAPTNGSELLVSLIRP
jgi:hypothetical protein